MAELAPVVGEGERHQTRVAGRAPKGDLWCELLDLMHRHVVGHVDWVGEAGGQLHGGMHRKRVADALAQAAALQERRRVDGATAHEDVAETDAPGGAICQHHLGIAGPGAVDGEAPDPALGQQARSGALGAGQVGAGHALALAAGGRTPRRVLHPAGAFAVLPVQGIGAALQHRAGG